MKLQGNILIPEAKLTQYLLIHREYDDKSKFLAQAGFTHNNSTQLKQAILTLIETHDAVIDRQNKYGTFYRVEGNLMGTKRFLAVVTIWLKRTEDGNIQFITLKPRK